MFESALKLSPKIRKFTSHVDILIESSRYTLETLSNPKDFGELFKLRHQAFLKGRKVKLTKRVLPLDLDKYDSVCDHILIKEKASGEIVGTYRVLSSLYTDSFYSENEFDLSPFLSSASGNVLELGRACITPAHRNGFVLDLLWKGVGQYCLKTQAKYLFGCASFWDTDKIKTLELIKYLKDEGHELKSFNINVTKKFKWKNNFSGEVVAKQEHIPALLKSYLKAGAKVNLEPAYDKAFKCFDFLTILDIDEMTSFFRKRYLKD